MKTWWWGDWFIIETYTPDLDLSDPADTAVSGSSGVGVLSSPNSSPHPHIPVCAHPPHTKKNGVGVVTL